MELKFNEMIQLSNLVMNSPILKISLRNCVIFLQIIIILMKWLKTIKKLLNSMLNPNPNAKNSNDLSVWNVNNEKTTKNLLLNSYKTEANLPTVRLIQGYYESQWAKVKIYLIIFILKNYYNTNRLCILSILSLK